MNYESLLEESDFLGLIVKEKPLKYNNGRIKGNRIAIRKDIETTVEKACVLAEEIGHYCTATGDILDQSSVENRKQEMKGRILAYDKLVGLYGIINANNHHCKNTAESAEYLGVTEEFLNDALSYYKRRYGTYTTVDNYVIIFEPYIAVIELI